MDKQLYSAQHRVLTSLLRELRLESGLRQADLTDSLGKPQSFVSKIETGERRLDVLELREICQALGLTLTEFAGRLEQRLAAAKTRPRRSHPGSL